MNAPVDPGLITIDVAVSGGRVCSVEIASSRPRQVGRVMAGRDLEEVGFLAGRLFGLCGFSQGAAAALAGAAARGRAPVPTKALALGLLAERVSDLLRSTVLGGLAHRQAIDAPAAAALRTAMAAGREIMAGSSEGATVEQLAGAARALGVVDPSDGAAAGSLFGALAEEIGRGDQGEAPRPDALEPEDDPAVAALMAEAGDEWLARPALPGRVVETGCYARRWRAADGDGALATRFTARLRDIAASLDDMRRMISGGAVPDGLAAALRHGPGQGFSSVESPRGRLYHLVRCDGGGRVVDYAILAPTEWNFHPAGPLVAALLGADPGPAPAARVERLAALFDPCVASRVRIRDFANA